MPWIANALMKNWLQNNSHFVLLSQPADWIAKPREKLLGNAEAGIVNAYPPMIFWILSIEILPRFWTNSDIWSTVNLYSFPSVCLSICLLVCVSICLLLILSFCLSFYFFAFSFQYLWILCTCSAYYISQIL